jgi:4-hydroxy-2-oxoheptanedioate aldolase
MPAPKNAFKAALRKGNPQIGLWLGLASPYTAEIAAGSGFDWLLIDGEHAPNDVPLVLAQLQGIAAGGGCAVVRAVAGETWMIKQLLDIGAQTVLVPMVETPQQALQLAQAVRYPPRGVRGVGAALARASRFNRAPDYLRTSDEEICLLVQLETQAGLEQIESIAAIDGIDGLFIGPSDLAADMGHLGNPGEPAVQAAIEDALKRIFATGKPAGILTSDHGLARRYLEMGATFVAVGTDVNVLSGALDALAGKFTSASRTSRSPSSGY